MTRIKHLRGKGIKKKRIPCYRVTGLFIGALLAVVCLPALQSFALDADLEFGVLSRSVNAYAKSDTPIEIKSNGAADLEVVKSADNLNPVPGSVITYTITAKNNGTAVLKGLWVKDNVPDNTTFISCDPSGVYGATDLGKEYVNWFIETLDPGDQVVLFLRVKADECSSGVAIENTALYEKVESSPVDPDITPDGGESNSVTLTAESTEESVGLQSGAVNTGDIIRGVAGFVGLVGVLALFLVALSYFKRRKK